MRDRGIAFGMRHYSPRHNCGSACCIAGWNHFLRTGETEVDMTEVNSITEGSAQGLAPGQWSRLFVPKNVVDFLTITPAHAAAVIRHLAATGEVSWEKDAGLSPGIEFEYDQEGDEPKEGENDGEDE